MSKVTSESAFEDSIEAHLLASGWLHGDPSGYDRDLGLVPSELVAFLAASQPDEWELLTQRLGDAASAKERVAKYVADQLTQRGTVDVLRGVIVDRHEANGQLFNAFFEKPGREALLIRYLAESYDEIRDEDVSSGSCSAWCYAVLHEDGHPPGDAQ